MHMSQSMLLFLSQPGHILRKGSSVTAVRRRSDKEERKAPILAVTHISTLSLPIVPKKLQSAFGYRLRKNPLWNLKIQTGLWNCDYFSTIQWRSCLIWPSSHKEIWIFVKEVILCPFLPSFVTGMYVVSTGRLCSQKTGLQSYYNFMHTFLTKVVPDNQKACQICKII